MKKNDDEARNEFILSFAKTEKMASLEICLSCTDTSVGIYKERTKATRGRHMRAAVLVLLGKTWGAVSSPSMRLS